MRLKGCLYVNATMRLDTRRVLNRSVVYGNVETGGIIERQSPTPLIYGIATEKADQEKLYDVIYAPVLEKLSMERGNCC